MVMQGAKFERPAPKPISKPVLILEMENLIRLRSILATKFQGAVLDEMYDKQLPRMVPRKIGSCTLSTDYPVDYGLRVAMVANMKLFLDEMQAQQKQKHDKELVDKPGETEAMSTIAAERSQADTKNVISSTEIELSR